MQVIKVAPDIIDVEITQEDIENGQRAQTQNCPLALALKKAGFAPVIVGHALAFVDGNGYSHNAHDFIRDFDGRVPVQPRRVVLLRRVV